MIMPQKEVKQMMETEVIDSFNSQCPGAASKEQFVYSCLLKNLLTQVLPSWSDVVFPRLDLTKNKF